MSTRSVHVARTDWGIFLVVMALLVVGVIMVYSASSSMRLAGWQDVTGPSYFFNRQLIYIAVGLAAMLVLWRIDYHIYRVWAIPIMGVTMLLLAVMALLGDRWLAGGSIQPFELAKIGAIIYIAAWLESRGANIRRITLGLLPFGLLLGAMAGLIIAQPNFSSTALLVVTAVAMFFVAGSDVKQLSIAAALAASALGAVASVVPYMRERLVTWPDPLSDPLKTGFSTVQSIAALTLGGLFGRGLGQSSQKIFLSRVAHSDYILAIIGEEWGFVGGVVIIVLYTLWVWRGFGIARSAADGFGRLLAVGIVMWVAMQAALNIAVVTNSSPATGTVLPFVSYGGSSITTGLAAVGILLNISRADHHRRAGRGP